MPGCHGVAFSRSEKEALWHSFCTAAPTTTTRIRAQSRVSQEPLTTLARRYGVSPKTLVHWWHRRVVEDLRPGGPRERKSMTLTPLEEAPSWRPSERRRAWHPTDVFCAPKPSIPSLTRCTLHRHLQRHGVSRGRLVRLGGAEGGSQELRGRLLPHRRLRGESRAGQSLLLRGRGPRLRARLRPPVAAQGHNPRLRRILSSRRSCGPSLTASTPPRSTTAIRFAEAGKPRRYGPGHPFGRLCRARGIEHRPTRPYRPWTNGQAERMIRTLKEAI